MSSLRSWRVVNGWREIFARIFEEFTTEFNVTPAWLVNPATNRRLKLDLLYPDIGVAVRFEGLTGKQKSRLSLEEEAQQRVRFDARVEVCWHNGIQLVVVDAHSEKTSRVFQQIDVALSRAAESEADADLLAKIRQARRMASSIGLKIKTAADLALYADLWTDRQYRVPEAAPTSESAGSPVEFVAGMAVEHAAFGAGVVISTEKSGGDTLITVNFVSAGQKTLAASLVAGKLQPRESSG
jgi:hypothetical protein